jgi:hypothetical protein
MSESVTEPHESVGGDQGSSDGEHELEELDDGDPDRDLNDSDPDRDPDYPGDSGGGSDDDDDQNSDCDSNNVQPTPEKEAHQFLRAHNISPTKNVEVAKELTSLNLLAEQVKRAPKHVKKEILKSPGKKIPRCASRIANKVNVHRQAVFHLRDKRNVKRLQNARNKLLVVDFLKQSKYSTPMPGKKDVLKKNVVKYTLNDTLSNLYIWFKEENPHCKMSCTTFKRQRPYWMIPILHARRRQCLCLYHQNANLKFKACKINDSPDLFLRNKNDDELPEFFAQLPTDDVISYSEWQKDKVNYGASVITKLRLHQMSTPREEFLQQFVQELKSLRQHIGRVNTQYSQLSNLRNNLKASREITVQMDYSENYNCVMQDEPSQVFFDRRQLTVHPLVMHYRSDDNKLQHHSFVGVSDERSHAAPTAISFISKFIPEAKKILPDLELIHYVTDSPASQYHNRNILHFLSMHKSEFGIEATWDYLESFHGKGPCDGVGASAKKCADIAVKSGVLITSAQNFVDWGTNSRSVSNMSFILVSPEEVTSAERKLRNVLSVKGISQMHSVRPRGQFLYMRETSCYDECCRDSPSCEGWVNTNVSVVQNEVRQTCNAESETAENENIVQVAENVHVEVAGDADNESGQPVSAAVEDSLSVEGQATVNEEEQEAGTSGNNAEMNLESIPECSIESTGNVKYLLGEIVRIKYNKKEYLASIEHVYHNDEYLVRFLSQKKDVYSVAKKVYEIQISWDSILESVKLDKSGRIRGKVDYKVGELVQVDYKGKLYVAKIHECNKADNFYNVTFMSKRKNGSYYWPRKLYELSITPQSILDYAVLDDSGHLSNE